MFWFGFFPCCSKTKVYFSIMAIVVVAAGVWWRRWWWDDDDGDYVVILPFSLSFVHTIK